MNNWIENLALSCEVIELKKEEFSTIDTLTFKDSNIIKVLCTNCSHKNLTSYILTITQEKLKEYLDRNIDDIFRYSNEVTNNRTLRAIMSTIGGLESDPYTRNYLRINTKLTANFYTMILYDDIILKVREYLIETLNNEKA